MSINISGLTPLRIPEFAISKTDESLKAPVSEDFVSKLFEEHRAKVGALKADNSPENLWGEIIVGGQTVAQIYKSGSTAYSGNARLNINTDASLDDIAKQLVKQIGGHLQLAQGRRNDI